MSTERWRFQRGLGQWRPPRELEEMRRRFEEDFARPFMRAVWERVPEEMKGWSPAVDVLEKGDSFVVKVELPGMKQEDFDVSVTDDTLEIRGERQAESEVKDQDYYRSEIPYGSFYRSVGLPGAVDTRNIEAAYENGILRITLQRASGAKPKRVPISIKKGNA